MAISISNISANEFTVEWTSHGSSVSSYNLEVYRGSTVNNQVYGISSSARSYRVSYNIQPGTEYEVKLYSRNSSGAVVKIEYAYPIPNSIGGVGTIRSISVTQTSFYVYWNNASHATRYSIEVRRGGSSGPMVYSRYGSLTSAGATISSLDPGTYYHIKAWGARPGYSNGSPSTGSVATQSIPRPSTPTNFRAYDIGTTAFSLSWNTVSGADRYVVEVFRTHNDAVAWSKYNITGGSVRTGTLASGVSYYAKLYANGAGGNSPPTYIYSIFTGRTRPSDWKWSVAKAKGMTYNITNDRYTNLITYDEIVSFRNRINSFRVYKNMSNFSFSSISKGSVFTAHMYNQMESAISAMNPPTSTYGQQSKGSSYSVDQLLNRLRASLNSIT